MSTENKRYQTKIKEEGEVPSVSEMWNKAATNWNQHIGQDGDWYRRHVTDSLVWNYIGDITDQVILDAGCGNGYITRKLLEKGAKKVIAIDVSPNMIDIALQNLTQWCPLQQEPVEFSVASCETLSKIQDSSVDTIISNFVLMDVENLEEAIKSFYRVLKPGGKVSIVILHPCFMSAEYERSGTYPNRKINFTWNFSYVEEKVLEVFSKFSWFNGLLARFEGSKYVTLHYSLPQAIVCLL